MPWVTGKCFTNSVTSRSATRSDLDDFGPGLGDPVLVVAGRRVHRPAGQRGYVDAALVRGEGAPGMERTAGGHVDQAGRLAGDRPEPVAAAPVEAGQAGEQTEGVGVAGGVVEGV